MAHPASSPLPPRKVFQRRLPAESSLAANASRFAVSVSGAPAVYARTGLPHVSLQRPPTYTLPLASTAMPCPKSVPLPPRKVFQTRLPDESSLAAKASAAPVNARTGLPHVSVLGPPTYTLPLASTAMLLSYSFPVPPRKVFQTRLPAESSLAAKASLAPVNARTGLPHVSSLLEPPTYTLPLASTAMPDP